MLQKSSVILYQAPLKMFLTEEQKIAGIELTANYIEKFCFLLGTVLTNERALAWTVRNDMILSGIMFMTHQELIINVKEVVGSQ